LVDALAYTQSNVANADESAMNLEGVGLFFRHYFDFPQHFCELGANFAENVASLSIATEQAASGRSYGLGLRESHTCLRYYLFLMYEGELTCFEHKNTAQHRTGDMRTS